MLVSLHFSSLAALAPRNADDCAGTDFGANISQAPVDMVEFRKSIQEGYGTVEYTERKQNVTAFGFTTEFIVISTLISLE